MSTENNWDERFDTQFGKFPALTKDGVKLCNVDGRVIKEFIQGEIARAREEVKGWNYEGGLEEGIKLGRAEREREITAKLREEKSLIEHICESTCGPDQKFKSNGCPHLPVMQLLDLLTPPTND